MLRSTKLASGLVLALAVAPVVQGAVTVNGILDVADGYTRYATQTNNTQFGDNLNPDGTSSGGSELNAAYAKIESGYLNLFIAGNLENNFNKLQIFLDDGRPGQSTLSATGGQGGIGNMSGAKFSPDFQGTYALNISGGGSTPYTFYVDKFDLATQSPASSQALGSFAPNNATANTVGPLSISVDNTNIAGVDGTAPSAANAANAEAVTTGVEIAIPLTQLGNPSGGNIKVMALINGGGSDYLSNQFLPGLPTVTGNLGATLGGLFDFSATAGQYFSVAVPVASNVGTWALSGGGSWGNAGNWTGTLPDSIASTAILGSAITGDAIITLDANRTVGRLTFNNAFKYTLSGGTLTIDDTANPSGGANPRISVLAGSHEIASAVSLFNGVEISVVSGASLTVNGSIGGIGNVVKSGTGMLVLGSGSTFIGDLIMEGGTTRINSVAALGSGAVILGDPTIDNQPATLVLGTSGLDVTPVITTRRDQAGNSNYRSIYSDVAGANTVSGNIIVNGGISLGAAAGGTLTVSGVIQNGTDTGDSLKYDVRVNGTGHVILTNMHTTTGDTFVDSGTLILNSGASLAGGSLNVFTNGVAIINGSLANNVKIYSQGKTYFPGAGVASVTLNTSTLSVDSGGLIEIGASTSSANPVIVNAGSVEFLGDFTGKIDLKNNQLITTNDATTVRNQLQANNLVTTSNGVLGYKDNGNATTTVQFAVAGDANLDGKVNTIDFNDLAGNFGTGQFWTQGDFNYNGTIDSTDFDILVANYGKSLPAGSPGLGSVVPEPASAALLAIGAMSLLGRRRRD